MKNILISNKEFSLKGAVGSINKLMSPNKTSPKLKEIKENKGNKWKLEMEGNWKELQRNEK